MHKNCFHQCFNTAVRIVTRDLLFFSFIFQGDSVFIHLIFLFYCWRCILSLIVNCVSVAFNLEFLFKMWYGIFIICDQMVVIVVMGAVIFKGICHSTYLYWFFLQQRSDLLIFNHLNFKNIYGNILPYL